MDKFEFISGSTELLDLIKPLWEKLNKHHEVNSNYFSERYSHFTFEARKNKFTYSQIKIDLIKDKDEDLYIAYCISSINKSCIGEIESIFVEDDYRGYGLGDKLMLKALEWLDDNKAKSKLIGVAEGNEQALGFYKKYGFYKRTTILEQKKS